MTKTRQDAFAPLILLVVVILFCLPIFSKPGGFAAKDQERQFRALETLFHFEHARMAIREFGQFALWSPYCDGGYPAVKDPANLAFSPLIISAWIFGSVAGLKILIILATWIGAWGVFLIARKICGFSVIAAIFSALSFAFAAWLPNLALEGEPNFILMFFPVIAYLALSANGSYGKIAGAGLILGLAILSGPHLALPMLYFLVILSFFYAVNHGAPTDASPLRVNLMAFAILILVSLPLALHELVPAWIRVAVSLGFAAYIFSFPAAKKLLAPAAQKTLSISLIIICALGVGYGKISSFLDLENKHEAFRTASEGPPEFREVDIEKPDAFYSSHGMKISAAGFELGSDIPGDNAYGHLGITWPLMALFCIGAVAGRRKTAPFTSVLMVSLFICYGKNLPINFHSLFARGIPLFDLLIDPFKHFSFFIIFSVALVGGSGFEWITGKTGRWKFAAAAATAAVLLIPFFVNRQIYKSAFEEPFPNVEAGGFHYIAPAPAGALKAEGYEIAAAYKAIFIRRQKDSVFAPGDRQKYSKLNPMPGVANHRGSLECPTRFPLAVNAEARDWLLPDDTTAPNPYYGGEASFYEAHNKVLIYRVAGNDIECVVDVKEGGLLTVNQNYDPDFTVSDGELTESSGRSAAVLPAPGRYTVRFSYRPKGVLRRFAVSGIFAIFLLALCLRLVFHKSRGHDGQ